MSTVMAAFYRNPIPIMVVLALCGALAVYLAQGSVAAVVFMVLGLLIVLWDAHTDPHIPEAPTIT
jgi:hypothetical protein